MFWKYILLMLLGFLCLCTQPDHPPWTRAGRVLTTIFTLRGEFSVLIKLMFSAFQKILITFKLLCLLILSLFRHHHSQCLIYFLIQGFKLILWFPIHVYYLPTQIWKLPLPLNAHVSFNGAIHEKQTNNKQTPHIQPNIKLNLN